MKEESKDNFQESMAKEVTDQFNNGNFTVIPKSEVPKGQTIQADEKKAWFEGCWINQEVQGQIEHWRLTNEKRWTLRQKYAPVVSWNSLRMLLTMTVARGWHTKQMNFVWVFAQGSVEKILYMKISAGMELMDGSNSNN